MGGNNSWGNTGQGPDPTVGWTRCYSHGRVQCIQLHIRALQGKQSQGSWMELYEAPALGAGLWCLYTWPGPPPGLRDHTHVQSL